MSITDDTEKGNILEGRIPEKLLIFFVFVAFCLISFALGRISALDEFSAPKTDVIITNTEIAQ